MNESLPAPTEYRNVVFRAIPGTKVKAKRLAGAAGACRFVWNRALAENREAYEAFKNGIGEKPSVSWPSLSKWFTGLRNAPETDWLREYPMEPVRYVLRYQADAWKVAFRGGGFPRFHSRHRGDSITIPSGIRVEKHRIWFPRIGWLWLRRRGGNPYAGEKAVKAVFRRVAGHWECCVTYEVPAPERPDNGLSLGLDRNVRQVATSDGAFYRLPDVARLEARRKRYQRQMARRVKGSNRRNRSRIRAAKVARKIAGIRKDWQHHVSRSLADSAGTIVIESLNTKAMTRSAKGTVEKPGKNVRQKAGLNRGILATGWTGLEGKLAYKTANLLRVPAAYTSQTCSACGHVEPENRHRRTFRCVVCGYADHADTNAAINILARGSGAAARGEALGLPTSAIREREAGPSP